MRRGRKAPDSDLESRLTSTHRANAPDLLRFIGRRVETPEDAADVLAETFLVAWRRIQHMPFTDTEARMWLYGIAKNTSTNWNRSAHRRNSLSDSLRDQIRHAPQTYEPISPSSLDVQRALDKLPPSHRELTILVHWDGFTIAEAGIILELPEATARSRYYKAKQLLRLELSEEAPSEAAVHQ